MTTSGHREKTCLTYPASIEHSAQQICDTRAGGAYEPGEAGAYWEWQSGRRYRGIDAPEREALYRQVDVGRERPALDIGAGDGALARHLAELGWRPTGIDCAPSALSTACHAHPSLDFRLFGFDTDDPADLPEPAFILITSRLVYRWARDKPAFLSRIRRLLSPGGTFWVGTSVHSPRHGGAKPWEISAADVELLTATWARADVTQVDETYHCFALRP